MAKNIDIASLLWNIARIANAVQCSWYSQSGRGGCQCYVTPLLTLLRRVSAITNRTSCTDLYMMTLGIWNGRGIMFPCNILSSTRPLTFYLNIIIVVIIWRGSNLILPLDWKGVLQLSLPIRQSDHTDKEWLPLILRTKMTYFKILIIAILKHTTPSCFRGIWD